MVIPKYDELTWPLREGLRVRGLMHYLANRFEEIAADIRDGSSGSIPC